MLDGDGVMVVMLIYQAFMLLNCIAFYLSSMEININGIRFLRYVDAVQPQRIPFPVITNPRLWAFMRRAETKQLNATCPSLGLQLPQMSCAKENLSSLIGLMFTVKRSIPWLGLFFL